MSRLTMLYLDYLLYLSNNLVMSPSVGCLKSSGFTSFLGGNRVFLRQKRTVTNKVKKQKQMFRLKYEKAKELCINGVGGLEK